MTLIASHQPDTVLAPDALFGVPGMARRHLFLLFPGLFPFVLLPRQRLGAKVRQPRFVSSGLRGFGSWKRLHSTLLQLRIFLFALIVSSSFYFFPFFLHSFSFVFVFLPFSSSYSLSRTLLSPLLVSRM